MAEAREVVITIKGSPEGKTPKTIIKNIVNNKVTNVINETKQSPEVSYDDEGTDISTSVLANQVFAALKKEIVTEAKYQVNKYFATRDDYIGQRNMNIAFSMANKAVSLGASVAMGATVGGPVGAIAALAVSTISMGVSAYNTLDAQNLKVDQMNAQLAFTRQRSGYSLTSGSTGEDK